MDPVRMGPHFWVPAIGKQGHPMQTAYKRLSVITGFGLLLLLILNALITRRQFGEQVESQAWVAHSRLVLYDLSQTESLLKDAETGQRGFLYTGDPKYLTPYTQAVNQVQSHLDQLARLTVDNPSEQVRVEALRDLTQKKMAELAQTLSLYKSGKFDEAKNLVLSDKGLGYMDNIRLLIAQMEREEITFNSDRNARYQFSIHRTVASIYLTSLFAAMGLILLAFYMLGQIELREQHAHELRAREEWFRITLTSIGDAVIATDQQGMVTFLNPVAETLTGVKLDLARGREINRVFPIFSEQSLKPVENPVKKVMEKGIVVGLANHTVLQHLDGSLIPIEDSAAPIRDDKGHLLGVVLVFRDVTHERKSQEVLRKTEKLASAARLSATVAHEINNPLEAIFNLVYVAKIDPETPPSVARQLTLAEQELERVAHITRQTLGFYRDSSVSEPVDLRVLLESILTLYSHKFQAKNILVQREYEPCPAFRGVPGELKQAISNLVSNAADAVSFEGTITVGLRRIEDKDNHVVEVTIADDGPGIPPAYADSIFEPFFTTKQDVGTGLGLWVAKGIVERHGGDILVRAGSDNGNPRGAAFLIHLPVNAPQSSDEPEAIAS
jgi:PAS domain S-box-containing protein